MDNFENLKPEIGNIAKKHNLSLVLLYGSQVKGGIHKEGDNCNYIVKILK